LVRALVNFTLVAVEQVACDAEVTPAALHRLECPSPRNRAVMGVDFAWHEHALLAANAFGLSTMLCCEAKVPTGMKAHANTSSVITRNVLVCAPHCILVLPSALCRYEEETYIS
jgi:hypothetical protein